MFKKCYRLRSRCYIIPVMLISLLMSGCGDSSVQRGNTYDQNDVNAQRIRGLGGVFRSLQRAPYNEQKIVEAAIRLSGTLEKQPDTCAEQAAWMAASGDLLVAYIAAGDNPDDTFVLQLIQTRDKLIGQLDGTEALCDEAQMERMAAVSHVYAGIALYPDEQERLIAFALQLLGPPGDPASWSKEVEAARLESFGALYTAMARYWRIETLDVMMLEAVTALAGDVNYTQPIDDQMLLAARMASFKDLYAGIAQYPGLKEELVATALALTGPTPDASTFGPSVQTARFASFGQVYEGQARNPEAIPLILEAVTALSGTVTYDQAMDDESVLAARMASFSDLYLGIARNLGLKEELVATALALTGPTGDPVSFSDAVQSARMTGLGGLYEGMTMVPGGSDLLVEASMELMGPVAEPLCKDLPFQVQGARMAGLHSLYVRIYWLEDETRERVLQTVEALAGKLQTSDE